MTDPCLDDCLEDHGTGAERRDGETLRKLNRLLREQTVCRYHSLVTAYTTQQSEVPISYVACDWPGSKSSTPSTPISIVMPDSCTQRISRRHEITHRKPS